ncbi:robable sensor/response regulator hybrid [Mesorhizobium alhagi CCNWXJ12-2]|uniref:histidine kinase n=2 Tax=Allomesorhizobium alhagi TaxID=475067 RepID=H0I371_9HYPH|nr:robable sensor/response regulator hybrid [Mesorhizobium alhagi CCNWXJ12-2]
MEKDMIDERPRTFRHCSTDDGTDAVAGMDPRILLASIVHDFNSLLTPIVTIMEDLQRQEVGSPRQLKRIDGAIFCAFRAKTLARQLLDFANPRELQLEAVDISQLLEFLEPVLASVLPSGITIRLDIDADLPPAFIDRHLIERALLNLVLNARDAMPDGGEVVVAAAMARQSGRRIPSREPLVRLSVADTGIGMNPATLRSAGVPYFSTKTNGTGLGLAMVSQMMERQGGGLSVTSTQYRGTAIDLWLPVMPPSSMAHRRSNRSACHETPKAPSGR